MHCHLRHHQFRAIWTENQRRFAVLASQFMSGEIFYFARARASLLSIVICDLSIYNECYVFNSIALCENSKGKKIEKQLTAYNQLQPSEAICPRNHRIGQEKSCGRWMIFIRLIVYSFVKVLRKQFVYLFNRKWSEKCKNSNKTTWPSEIILTKINQCCV